MVSAYFVFTVLLGLAGHSLLWAWMQRVFPAVRRHRRIALPLIVLASLGAGVFRVLARRTDWGWASLASMLFGLESLAVLVSAVLSLLLTSLVFAGLWSWERLRGTSGAALSEPIARAAAPGTEDATALADAQPVSESVRAGEGVAKSAEPAEEPTPDSRRIAREMARAAPKASALTRRQLIERSVGLGLYASAGSALGWGMVRGRYDYRVEELVVRVPGLSPKLDGYTLAQVSDLHAGPFVSEQDFDYGFSFLKQFKPDLVIATGDLIDHDARYAPMLARKLAELGARDGTVAILGNHDYYAGAERVEQAMRAAGVELLVNQSLHLRRDEGSGLAIVGLDDYAGVRHGRGPQLQRTLAGLDPRAQEAPRIALAHQPPFFDQLWGHAFLQLSGHTHGGQINPPGVNVAELVGMRYVQGAYKGANDSLLWVNRGFGVAGPPSRINAPPEITKIVLVSA